MKIGGLSICGQKIGKFMVINFSLINNPKVPAIDFNISPQF